MRESRIYLATAVLSLVFYVVGVMSGLFIEKSMTEYTEEKVRSLQRQVENIQLEYIYLNTMGSELNCEFLSVLLGDTTKEVWSIRNDLVKLEDKQENTVSERYQNLKRDYALLSTRAWILNSYVKNRCKEDVVVVLYLYSVPCPDCIKQGNVLDEVREEFQNKMRVFVLDVNLDEPIVQTLKKTYNLTLTPSLIIGNSTYSGLIEKERLRAIISEELKGKNGV